MVLAAVALLIGVGGGPVAAAPATDDEGGTTELRKALDEANRGFLDAQAALEQSKKRQAELTTQQTDTETRLTQLRDGVDEIAQVAYRAGGLQTASAILGSDSPDAFVDKATTLSLFAMRNDRQLRELNQARERLATAQAEIQGEITKQQQQVDQMAKSRAAAETALRRSGGGAPATGPATAKTATAAAKPAPRRANGTFPTESCSGKDPTTDGCLTPRTAHALAQAKAAGFTRFVSCHRDGGGGEHPKGRACDFAADQKSFGGVAVGDDRTYGNNLAEYFRVNADKLGVLYVIWFRQIWQPTTGWKSYSGGNGDPSSDHTNHVHLSVY